MVDEIDRMIDVIDRKILDSLSEDAHRSLAETAKSVSISAPYLSKKLAALRKMKVIKWFSVEIDYDQLGYNVHALSFVSLKDQHHAARIIDKIKAIDEAIEVFEVLGHWDLYVRWICRSNSQVMDFVQGILEDESVANVETTTLARERKRKRGPRLVAK
jgi:Lrp/AsnC family transcriptional regulator, regulator for asnA, asnC and gidA